MNFWGKKAKEARETYSAYRDVFNSEKGQIVLKDLMKSGFFSTSTLGDTPHMTYYNEGMREIVMRIIKTAGLSKEQVTKMTQQLEQKDLIGGTDEEQIFSI